MAFFEGPRLTPLFLLPINFPSNPPRVKSFNFKFNFILCYWVLCSNGMFLRNTRLPLHNRHFTCIRAEPLHILYMIIVFHFFIARYLNDWLVIMDQCRIEPATRISMVVTYFYYYCCALHPSNVWLACHAYLSDIPITCQDVMMNGQ